MPSLTRAGRWGTLQPPFCNPRSSSNTGQGPGSAGTAQIPPGSRGCRQVLGAGGASPANRIKSHFPEFISCPAACLWRSGVLIVVLSPLASPQHPISDFQGISSCLSSKLLHMALSSLNISIWAGSTIPILFFHYSLFCMSWSVIKPKSCSPLNTLNNCL